MPSAPHHLSLADWAASPCRLNHRAYVSCGCPQLHLRRIRPHAPLTRLHLPHHASRARVGTSNSKFVWSGVRSCAKYRCTSWRNGLLTHLSPRTRLIQVSLKSTSTTVAAIVVAFSRLDLVAAVLKLIFKRRALYRAPAPRAS